MQTYLGLCGMEQKCMNVLDNSSQARAPAPMHPSIRTQARTHACVRALLKHTTQGSAKLGPNGIQQPSRSKLRPVANLPAAKLF